MYQRKLLLAAIVSSTFAAVSLPVLAEIDFHVDIAPPAARYEAVPAPRHGYVWAPGFWDYRGHRYVWTKGHWERERSGYFYHPSTWSEHDGHWYRYNGRWSREEAHPTRYDGHAWRSDRDGDGVPDSRDRAPDNPRRN